MAPHRSLRRSRLAAATLAVLAIAVGVAHGEPSDPATEVIVTVGTQRFDPEVVELRRSVRLTFHCLAELPGGLVVVAADRSFETWPLGMYGEWSHRFTKAGTFEYFVKQHPETRGRAIVR